MTPEITKEAGIEVEVEAREKVKIYDVEEIELENQGLIDPRLLLTKVDIMDLLKFLNKQAKHQITKVGRQLILIVDFN